MVSIKDVKRSLLIKVRSLGYSVPDHYYRLGTEASFHGVNEMSELFTIGLPKLADEYLTIHGNKVYVKGERMNDWQLMLPLIPPLLLVTMKIWKVFGPITKSITDFAYNHLVPTIKYTAIPSAYLLEMEALKKENHGFDDLHIHLNGTVETDLAWHDFLLFPEVVYQEIIEACSNDKVKEQLEQLTGVHDSLEFLQLFSIAGRIREWLFCKVNFEHNLFETTSFENLLNKLVEDNNYFREHPCEQLLRKNTSPLILEGLFYVNVLDYMSVHPHDDAVAGAFHYYLLILGLCHKLMVQQTDTFGFEQFQKYTFNNLREFSEKTYRRRFLQLSGNDMNNIRHIEGRFSPKDTLDRNVDIINKIRDGFECLKRYRKNDNMSLPSMALVAHFIKKVDNSIGDVRFERLRNELNLRTRALIALKNTNSTFSNILVGVDAAASEFDTPPEVFAPSFHKLRKSGIRHFTYHAGEDFFHVLSGLRAIYEAIEYLDLQAGDRIGHATAAGIDVKLWRENINERLWMRIEDYLDDLVFAYHLIVTAKERALEPMLPKIALKIEEYAARIYPNSYSVCEFIDAWLKRKEDPLCVRQYSRIDQLYLYYHSKEVREKGKEIILVGAYDIFGEKELICLQKLLLRVMHQKQIVIETLPTSNVIIGHHHSFSTYHLYNWYRWSKEGEKLPAIVVGTDDAGIFATNIYNEYCHIYCMLVFDNGLSPDEAIDYIERLVHNAKVYAFK